MFSRDADIFCACSGVIGVKGTPRKSIDFAFCGSVKATSIQFSPVLPFP